MNNIQKLQDLFKQFPGIGPRQAKRFVYFLLNSTENYRASLIKEISELASSISLCISCFRFFGHNKVDGKNCPICDDLNRDKKTLMIVAKDVDFEAIEKSKIYKGYYFILGNTLSLTEKEPEKKVRSRELLNIIEKRQKEGLTEIILALSLNNEGENTREFIEELISPIIKKYDIKIYVLGRGLSTGTEIEYSDTETIKNALIGKKEEFMI